jgi:hypothetical protein
MNFLVYKRTDDEGIALEITNVLKANDIAFHVVEDKENLDSLYGDKEFARQFFIKINEKDFAKADLIFEQQFLTEIKNVDRGYYLFSFSNEELFDIVNKRDEWGEFDFQLAKVILKERGNEITTEMVTLLKEKRLKELSKPEKDQTDLVYYGYAAALLGGFVGIFIGWHLNTHKKILPNGRQIYAYRDTDRKQGLIIFVIGLIIFPFALYWKFFRQ